MPLDKLVIPVPPELQKTAHALIEDAKRDIGFVDGTPLTPQYQVALQRRVDELVEERNHWPIVLEWRQ